MFYLSLNPLIQQRSYSFPHSFTLCNNHNAPSEQCIFHSKQYLYLIFKLCCRPVTIPLQRAELIMMECNIEMTLFFLYLIQLLYYEMIQYTPKLPKCYKTCLSYEVFFAIMDTEFSQISVSYIDFRKLHFYQFNFLHLPSTTLSKGALSFSNPLATSSARASTGIYRPITFNLKVLKGPIDLKNYC